ncbi:hypothetical protein, partial [Shigella dysenteriae]|uniref:hypothetical protein n=1 Tax=Shigella dysenteriae TaxID=622 RepID=UPI001C0A7B33
SEQADNHIFDERGTISTVIVGVIIISQETIPPYTVIYLTYGAVFLVVPLRARMLQICPLTPFLVKFQTK